MAAPVIARADHSRSAHHVIAENPNARFNPKVQALLIEERLARRLARPQEVEFSSPYLPRGNGSVDSDIVLDQQIRRLGELIRQQPAQ
jgi:hypothetical protein